MPSVEMTSEARLRSGCDPLTARPAGNEPAIGLPGRAAWTRDLELLFLVGSPRSGTTWLQGLIASHPEIHTGPETQFFGAYGPVEQEYVRVKDGRCGISEYLSKEAFYDLLAESFWRVVSALPEPEHPPRLFLEKSPYHCVFAPLILKVFPRARFLHLIRDARAVVASMLRISKSWGESWAPDTAERATTFWYECVSAGCAISDLVSSPDQYLGIRYEDVRADQAGYLAGLYDWLGLGWDAALIQEAIDANSLDRTRGTLEPFPAIPMPGYDNPLPKYPAGFVGSAALSAGEAELSPEDRRTVDRMAVDVLQELGYPV
jgi:hypothetical protein